MYFEHLVKLMLIIFKYIQFARYIASYTIWMDVVKSVELKMLEIKKFSSVKANLY